MPRPLAGLPALSLLLLLACSSGSSQADAVDAPAADPGADVTPDLPDDLGPDGAPDLLADGTPDLPADLPADPGPEAGDVTPEVPDVPDYSGVPILERPVQETVTCTTLHDALPLADTFATWMGADIAGVDEQVVLVRVEGAGEETVLKQSTIAFDATLGAPITLDTLSGWAYARPRLAGGPERVAVIYSASEAVDELTFLAADASGAVLDGPRVLDGTDGLSDAGLAAGAGGYAVLGVAAQGKTVRFLRLDDHGSLQGAAVDLPSQGVYVNWPAPQIVPVDGGWVATWTESGASSSRAAVARLDPDGQVEGDVLRLEPVAGGEATRGPAVIEVGGGLLVAWTETHTPADWNEPGWSIVQVRRTSSALAPLGEVARVQDPSKGLACHTPVWTRIGVDTPGLAFACGVLYTICAGCVPTETLGFVALHPASLVPASKKALLKSSTGAGGLLNARIVRQVNDYYVYADLTYHALNQPSLAALHCE